MKDWFKIEAIDSGTYAISEYGHIEETHSYLVLGSERAALIDTGLGVSDILAAVRQLTELPVCVLTTHAHWDHIGGHGLFEHIAAHELEAGWLSGSFPLPPDTVRSLLTAGLRRRPEGFDAAKYGVYCGGATQLQRDGDVFELGGRRLRVLHTPGHSPGSCCYLKRREGICSPVTWRTGAGLTPFTRGPTQSRSKPRWRGRARRGRGESCRATMNSTCRPTSWPGRPGPSANLKTGGAWGAEESFTSGIFR